MAAIIPLPTNKPRRRVLEPLWREALGERLRRLRHERGERLADTAERAGVSPQYLSEIERGLKEPSSEMIAAVAGALDVTLIELTTAVVDDLRAAVPERGAPERAMPERAVPERAVPERAVVNNLAVFRLAA